MQNAKACMNKQFYVYTHARPDGRVFYVGKGCARRAHDFSPARRTPHHLNIIKKYGRDQIRVEILNCVSEAEAFDRERDLIRSLRESGHSLVNLTMGGEGASGRLVSQEFREHARSEMRRVWASRPRNTVPKPSVRALTCPVCKAPFETLSSKAVYCGKKCGRDASNKRRDDALRATNAVRGPALYSSNSSGIRGVYVNHSGRWSAHISVNRKLIHLGVFDAQEDAVTARRAAERARDAEGAEIPRLVRNASRYRSMETRETA